MNVKMDACRKVLEEEFVDRELHRFANARNEDATDAKFSDWLDVDTIHHEVVHDELDDVSHTTGSRTSSRVDESWIVGEWWHLLLPYPPNVDLSFYLVESASC